MNGYPVLGWQSAGTPCKDLSYDSARAYGWLRRGFDERRILADLRKNVTRRTLL
jgi:hypothetical protein